MSRFSLPQLKYEYDDLEPSIDSETMKTHHSKHHRAYVDGLNNLSEHVPATSSLHNLLNGLFENTTLTPQDKDILTRFGGGHYNHSLFWRFMSKESHLSHISELLFSRIRADFGSLESFQLQFDEASVKVFGSGWAWWVYDYAQKKSYIISTKDQVNPVMFNKDLICLLGLDVWEHAYYLKYQNRRKEYISNFWNVVNWKLVSRIHDELASNKAALELTDDGYLKLEK
ncbi:hypothetical protein GINT2_000290 [Glugoides intestinalis]